MSPSRPAASGPARRKRTARVPADDLAVRTWLSVGRCHHRCLAVLTQRLAGLGVRLQEHEILLNLLREPGLTQQELARRCLVTKSGASMLVSGLEAKGLLQRLDDAQDARAWRLSLTAAGTRLAEKCRDVQGDVVAAMTAGQSAAVMRTVRDAMDDATMRLEQMLERGQRPL